MDDAQAWAYLVAVAIPLVVGLLSKASLKSWLKFLITVVLCAIIGVVAIRLTAGTWDIWSLPYIVSIIGAAEIYYRFFVKNIPGLTEWLAAHVVKDKV